MASPALVRVKRVRTENPLEALVLSSKRRKYEDDKEVESVTTILTFAGTVKTQEENVQSQLSRAVNNLKGQAQNSYKKPHIPNVTEKLRSRIKSKSVEDRYKVVNFYRFQGCQDKDSCENAENITVVDIEATGSEDSGGAECLGYYEYDLYYVESAADLCLGVLDSVVSVQPYELVNAADLSEEEYVADDSDNEDDESNWRNDYPDERSDEDDDDNGTRRFDTFDDVLMERMQKFGIESGEELSSDDDADALVYGRCASPFEEYRSRCMREIEDDTSSNEEMSNYDSGDDK